VKRSELKGRRERLTRLPADLDALQQAVSVLSDGDLQRRRGEAERRRSRVRPLLHARTQEERNSAEYEVCRADAEIDAIRAEIVSRSATD
jgi:hypothetical protein